MIKTIGNGRTNHIDPVKHLNKLIDFRDFC